MWLAGLFVCLHFGPILGHQLSRAPDPISPDTTVDESFPLHFAFVLLFFRTQDLRGNDLVARRFYHLGFFVSFSISF